MNDFTDTDSPAYQAAYQAETARLEGATAKTETVTEAAAIVADVNPVEARLAELEAEAASTKKALKDTKAALTRASQRASALEREREQAANRPPLLDNLQGIEDVVRYVNQNDQQVARQADQLWFAVVSDTIPDIETLLGDADFESAAMQRREQVGIESWKNPNVAIRELTDLKVQHLTRKNVDAAVSHAKADAAKKAKELSALRVPGGSGRASAPETDQGAADVWAMSGKDFAARRDKVLGIYSR